MHCLCDCEKTHCLVTTMSRWRSNFLVLHQTQFWTVLPNNSSCTVVILILCNAWKQYLSRLLLFCQSIEYRTYIMLINILLELAHMLQLYVTYLPLLLINLHILLMLIFWCCEYFAYLYCVHILFRKSSS